MRIAATYSHLNGLEFLEARQGALLQEIKRIIGEVDAERCRTKVCKEKSRFGKMLYSPKDLNAALKKEFELDEWKGSRTTYWVCEDWKTNRRIVDLKPSEQKAEIERARFTPIRTSNQTDFVKDKVAIEVQLGKYSFVAYDLFVKHMAFYVADKIDVGVEILPMKSLLAEMSSGPSFYEKELNNLIRGGRGVPPVPLVMFGIEP
jgi:hypothetical protein